MPISCEADCDSEEFLLWEDPVSLKNLVLPEFRHFSLAMFRKPGFTCPLPHEQNTAFPHQGHLQLSYMSPKTQGWFTFLQ